MHNTSVTISTMNTTLFGKYLDIMPVLKKGNAQLIRRDSTKYFC